MQRRTDPLYYNKRQQKGEKKKKKKAGKGNNPFPPSQRNDAYKGGLCKNWEGNVVQRLICLNEDHDSHNVTSGNTIQSIHPIQSRNCLYSVCNLLETTTRDTSLVRDDWLREEEEYRRKWAGFQSRCNLYLASYFFSHLSLSLYLDFFLRLLSFPSLVYITPLLMPSF